LWARDRLAFCLGAWRASGFWVGMVPHRRSSCCCESGGVRPGCGGTLGSRSCVGVTLGERPCDQIFGWSLGIVNFKTMGRVLVSRTCGMVKCMLVRFLRLGCPRCRHLWGPRVRGCPARSVPLGFHHTLPGVRLVLFRNAPHHSSRPSPWFPASIIHLSPWLRPSG
jgi:hypothetical protein